MISDDIKTWVRSAVFHQAPLCIAVIDKGFRIVEANHEFEVTFGDWQDRYCYSVYRGREERCEGCMAVRIFADGKPGAREMKGLDRFGEPIDYLVHKVPLVRPDGEVPFIVEISTDIRHLKNLEKEKLDAERLAAVGQTVAGLAHGIKNIIMGLEGGMYVMNSGIRKGDNARIGTGWEMLEDNVARISAFVKEFLEFARGRQPSVSLTDANVIVKKVVDLYLDTAALAGIEVKAVLASGLAPIAVDAGELHMCLANLVSNALDACEMSDKDNRCVTIATDEEDGVVTFEVKDNGCGMDYEVKKKVFTNFFSTKGSDKGTGLGLLTTRKVVQEHGGSIHFESTKDLGSEFRIRLPRERLPELQLEDENGNDEVENNG